MKKIVIALDYSSPSEAVAAKGFELATALNAEVTLVHILSDIAYYSSLNYSPITGFDSFNTLEIVQSNTLQELMDAAQKFLDHFKSKYGSHIKVDTAVGEGDFADEILRIAKEKNTDIIVMGTHGRKGIDKIFMGSVAETVLHKTAIPVFIIPIRNT